MSVQAKSKLPLLCGTVIVSEVLVLYFAGLTGYGLRPDLVPYGVFVGLLTFTALVLITAAALLPRRRFEKRPGMLLGWTGQGLILALGIIMPALILIAAIFGSMWAVGAYWGRRIDREAAEREAAEREA
ncbi:DUF4233 domain-containing protein [Brevibacterium jeotgali]|uniref:DUF4233 domain-containing protein n=1 Tax=Brevibacterium jeotgali TaxID=1262550 RepID=A0A2H1L7V2_9MICO|nr:DUF4233 domain-containing protein [Brevibacterium jeotgali]TWC03121.1 uncharacterized protein DUF4233 [Brevibacterium jeotgali]SMY12820.1 Protein of unknown function (DUF4233) [Brevibacterium jeotgali]